MSIEKSMMELIAVELMIEDQGSPSDYSGMNIKQNAGSIKSSHPALKIHNQKFQIGPKGIIKTCTSIFNKNLAAYLGIKRYFQKIWLQVNYRYAELFGWWPDIQYAVHILNLNMEKQWNIL